MRIALGIDTGGTYTDAVLVDHETGEVLASAKALTTRHDLAIGIQEAIATVFGRRGGDDALRGLERAGRAVQPSDIVLVGLSTTLATNAMVEGQGGPVCLLLVGYDPQLMSQYGFHQELGTDDFVYVQGGHNEVGNEVAPLDEVAVREAVLARRDMVEAFAVSGYFGVRNPAHELRVRELIEELCQGERPVTCGHELSSRLNAVRRATTAALNARLIAPLRELIATVRRTLDQEGIDAPLMVVKGDGSLVEAEWAKLRPIETILSGPAASVVGAWHLAGRRDAWVVDVGGTTTDIAALHEGWPTLNVDGARVGGWRTMVQAIDVHTSGLGGDSAVRWLDGNGGLTIGPRRVVPLSLLASTYPGVLAELRRQVTSGNGLRRDLGEFVLAWRQPASQLADTERELLAQLARGPRSLAALIGTGRHAGLLRARIEDLAARGLVQRSAFTPTDALHVLGRFTLWSAEASRLAAQLLAEQAGEEVEAFCERVVASVARRVATELVSKVLEDETGLNCGWEQEPAATLLARALGAAGANPDNGPRDLECAFTLRRPIVAIGAPVEAYLPATAAYLHTDLTIPPYAGVANAVGAVAGGVIQRVHALISPLPDEGDQLRLFWSGGHRDYSTLAEAVAHAEEELARHAEALARQAGAEHIEVRMTREDHYARAGGTGPAAQEVYLGTDLVFIAAGRPASTRVPGENGNGDGAAR